MNFKTSLLVGALACTVVLAVAKAVDSIIPAEMVGEWKWGTINPRTFYDKDSGAYLGHGGGMSCYFVFGKDGTYHKYFYVEQSPTAGWTTKSWSESEGKMSVSDGIFTLKPTKGRYRAEDNRVSRNNFDRPMNEDDLKREAGMKYGWSMGKDEKGRTVMFVAPGGTGQGSRFSKVK